MADWNLKAERSLGGIPPHVIDTRHNYYMESHDAISNPLINMSTIISANADTVSL